MFLDRRTVGANGPAPVEHEMPPEPLPDLPPTDHADDDELPF
jgi:hypothetical protein